MSDRLTIETLVLNWKRDNEVELNDDQLHALLYGVVPRIEAEVDKARREEHKILWEIVPSDAEHIETVKDISDLRVLKLEAHLNTQESEEK